MAGKGPPKTPTKILKDRDSWRALRPSEPVVKSGVPTRPDWAHHGLDADWKRIGKQLADAGVLSRLDQVSFTLLIDAIYEYWRAKTVGRSDEVRVWWSNLLRVSKEFGMSPASRAGLISLKPKDESQKKEKKFIA